MFWRTLTRQSDRADQFRRVHETWLTHAMDSARCYPRIPVRPVVTGGFARLRASGTGRGRARDWWTIALSRID